MFVFHEMVYFKIAL